MTLAGAGQPAVPPPSPANRPRRATEAAPGTTTRQRLMPEAAANPGGYRPRSSHRRPAPERLWDGHLTAECSIRHGGGPACPACLGRELAARLG